MLVVLAVLAVIFGAFGAHWFKNQLSHFRPDIYKTASFYHFVHTLAIFIIVLLSKEYGVNLIWAYFFMLGIFLFSGSLYLIACFQFNKLGILTPLGGLLFIIGWSGLGVNFLQKKIYR